MKRHERPYGCTFPKCHKTFGSKADWKRHENSQHFHLQCWRCTQRDTTGLECARLFYRQEMYVQHLSKDHKIENRKDIDTFIRKNRIGRNGQSQFWCGFCKMIIPLKQQGLEAWNERFNHIDTEHFKNGERIGDWLPPEGHLTKEKERDEEKRKKAEERRNNENATASAGNNNNHNCENDTTSNSSDSSCGDDDEIGESTVPATTTTAAAAASSGNNNRVQQDTAREMFVEVLDVRPQNASPVPASRSSSRKRKLPADEAVTAQSYENTIAISKANATAATTRGHGQSRTSNPATSRRRLNPATRGGASSAATSQRLADRERRETAALLFSTTEEPEKRNGVFCVSWPLPTFYSIFCRTVCTSFYYGKVPSADA